MDVKHTTLAALPSSMGQAHVDPEKGRQGDFEHWQRIFDATDRPAGDALARPAEANDRNAAHHHGRSPQANSQTTDRAGHQPRALQHASIARPGQAIQSPALSEAHAASPAPGHAAGSPSVASPAGPVGGGQATASSAQASPCAQPVPRAPSGAGLPTSDGRPLAQLEAHLSRGADGRLSVALRSNQPLSTAQALHAVAQALATQDGEAPVDQVLLNGQPIYRSAKPSTHRFEIDC